jgi:ABC-2 type transport system ATP-binding protein
VSDRDTRGARLDKNQPEAALVVEDLYKAYRQGFWGRTARPALRGVSFVVPHGQVFALLGHNGAGKTTTMKAILGLVRLQRGRIEIGGLDARRPEARARVGYLPESPSFHENLTARELLDFHGRLCGLDVAGRRRRIATCLEDVGMAEHAGRRVGACSKGMRQRIGLAQALLGEPELLILDEPQSGLDPQGRRQVRDILLARKRAGVTIVFSSHIVPDVEAVADQVAMIQQGQVSEIRDLSRGTPAGGFMVRIAQTGTDPALVGVASAADLARLLTNCVRDGVEVLDVQRGGGNLEEAFLERLSQPQPEVATC